MSNLDIERLPYTLKPVVVEPFCVFFILKGHCSF